MVGTIETRLSEIGVTLPEAAKPVANYVPYLITGNQLFISGQLPMGADGLQCAGQLGSSVSVEQGRDAARLCAINILAQAKAALGELDRIEQLVKLTGFVSAAPEFGEHPQVINGASDFMVEAMGDMGRHARSAVGVASLPFGAAVEVEAIFQVAP